MNDFSLIFALRIVHVVSGVLWAGAMVFLAWFLLPALRGSGAAGGSVIQQLVRVRRLPAYLVTVMLLTVVSGLLLFRHDTVTFGAGWMRTGPGMTFSMGAAFALVAATIGVLVNTPTAKRLSALGASIQAGGKPPSADQAATLTMLQARLARASYAAASLLLVATAAMAIARYVP
jgi:uncharacterized membrane protein